MTDFMLKFPIGSRLTGHGTSQPLAQAVTTYSERTMGIGYCARLWISGNSAKSQHIPPFHANEIYRLWLLSTEDIKPRNAILLISTATQDKELSRKGQESRPGLIHQQPLKSVRPLNAHKNPFLVRHASPRDGVYLEDPSPSPKLRRSLVRHILPKFVEDLLLVILRCILIDRGSGKVRMSSMLLFKFLQHLTLSLRVDLEVNFLLSIDHLARIKAELKSSIVVA